MGEQHKDGAQEEDSYQEERKEAREEGVWEEEGDEEEVCREGRQEGQGQTCAIGLQHLHEEGAREAQELDAQGRPQGTLHRRRQELEQAEEVSAGSCTLRQGQKSPRGGPRAVANQGGAPAA